MTNHYNPHTDNRGPDYPTETIRERRIARGITQMKLATLLECHLDTVRSWEQGRMNPSPHYQEKLEQILGTIDKKG